MKEVIQMILNEASGMSKVKKTKKKKNPSKLPMFQNHKATDTKKKKGHILAPIKKALTPPKKTTLDRINENKAKATKKKKSVSSAGLEPNKYHGKTTSSNVGKSKVAPVQKKLPKRVPASSPAKKTTTTKKPTTSKPKTTVTKKPVVSSPKKTTTTPKTTVTNKPKTTTTKKPTTTVKKPPVAKTTPAKKPVTTKARDWSKVTSAQLDKDAKLRSEYFKANPTSTYTKNWETKDYNRYNDMIMNNKGMTDSQRKYYNKMLGKWGWDDYNDVNVQQQYHLKQDKTKAIDAQTTSLNQSLSTMDAQAFQDKQAMQQEMSNRGITDSGIAADAYNRAQALNGQNYSAAYAQSAQDKADISAKYTDLINQSKQTQAEAKAAQEAQTAESVTAQLKAQTEQDKYLTSSTGYVYLNGKVLKDKNGKPLTSVAYQKMLEDNRHNQAVESANMQKINNDLALATQKLKLNYATLDLKSQQAQAAIANAQAKLELAARNADTAEVRVQAGILNSEVKSIQKQIDGYRRSDKKVPKSLKDKLKAVMSKMDKLANMGK